MSVESSSEPSGVTGRRAGLNIGPEGRLAKTARVWMSTSGARAEIPFTEASAGVPAASALPIALGYSILKRAIDIVVSASALLILSPLLVAIAVAIKLTSPGPVLFRQRRFGRNREPFRILKFRTMHAPCCDEAGLLQTGRNDPRVTPLGKALRRRNLDELPQLANILKGEMSLVGPRPHAVGMAIGQTPYSEIVPRYHLRHRVRPGLTGLAQVNGCVGPVDNRGQALRRQAWDLAYVRDVSLSVDVGVIVRTARQFVRQLFWPARHSAPVSRPAFSSTAQVRKRRRH